MDINDTEKPVAPRISIMFTIFGCIFLAVGVIAFIAAASDSGSGEGEGIAAGAAIFIFALFMFGAAAALTRLNHISIQAGKQTALLTDIASKQAELARSETA